MHLNYKLGAPGQPVKKLVCSPVKPYFPKPSQVFLLS